MRTSQQPSSFLENQPHIQTHKIPKQQNQFKALFIKNTILQSKQIGTNICQVFTPIICLIFTYLMKTIASQNLSITFAFDSNPYPYKFNDFSDFDQLNNDTRIKLQYYLYSCGPNCNSTVLEEMRQNIRISDRDVDFFSDPYNQINVSQPVNVPLFSEYRNTNAQLYKRLDTIGIQNFSMIRYSHGRDYLPDGAVTFDFLTSQQLNANFQINDCRDLDYHRTNGITRINQTKYLNGRQFEGQVSDFIPPYGMLALIHMVVSAFIQVNSTQTIGSGYVFMPQSDNQNGFVEILINSVSALIFPLGLSLLFPVFLYTIVLEKEERLIQMMKMNGLKIRYYWLTFFIFNLLLCLITNGTFYLVGTFGLKSKFFLQTSGSLMFIVMLGWSLSMVGMAAFFQTFLSSSRSANIIGYLISIWTSMIGGTLNLGVYQYPSQFPLGLTVFPPFAFVRAFYVMLMQCSNADCFTDLDTITQQLKNCIISIYIGFLFFFLLGAYLFQIIPQQFGVKRSPLFPFTSCKNIFKKKSQIQFQTQRDPQLRDYVAQNQEDQFSKLQRSKVAGFSEQDQDIIKGQYSLVINNMRKLYRKEGVIGMYPAVRSFNLSVAKNQTFGLLGPNGAGKTTLISMITGMFEPDHGNAWIGGYDIKTNISKAQLQMGVCPQFDLIWPQLTIQEHLYFYGRLKGVPSSKLKQKVQTSIQQVKLTKFAKFAAKQLSGGMKRRLSVAISLVGDPQIVFLDQPSTGLDPQNRRQLWAVLAQCQTKRALFITTHMMQEADTLCNRIGIITSGVLRTIQTPMKLKKVYGQGFDVIINTVKSQKKLISSQALNLQVQQEGWFQKQSKLRESVGSFIQQQSHKSEYMKQVNRKIVNFMTKQFPGTYLHKNFNGYLIFKVPLTYKISFLFQTMNLVQKQLGFSDVAITNSSLQDVFMNVVLKFDQDAKKEVQQFSVPELKQNNNEDYRSSNNQFQSIPVKRQQSQEFDSIISKHRQSILSSSQTPVRKNGSKDYQNQNQGHQKNQEPQDQNQQPQDKNQEGYKKSSQLIKNGIKNKLQQEGGRFSQQRKRPQDQLQKQQSQYEESDVPVHRDSSSSSQQN